MSNSNSNRSNYSNSSNGMIRSNVSTSNNNNLDMTPLHRATINNNKILVEFLLSKGAKPNEIDNKGKTPLYWASRKGHVEVVKLLLDAHDANVNVADVWGDTPLIWAVIRGHIDVVKLLLKVPRINVNKQNRWGQPPLKWASFYGHTEILKLLLAVPDIDVNRADDFGKTPLHHATWRSKVEAVKLLLAAPGIKVNQATKKGQTPLDFATSKPIRMMILKKMGLTIPYRNMNNHEKNAYKHVLLRRLLTKKRKNKNFVDPVSHINYNMRTLEPINKRNGNALMNVGLIINNKDTPIRLVNYNSINSSRRRSTHGTIYGLFNKDWSLIRFTKDELNKAYRDLALERVSAMAKSARTRKNLSTIRSLKSSNNNKAAARSRIKRNENKTGTMMRHLK